MNSQCNLREIGSGALGNNRFAAVISDQIAIIMSAANEDVARQKGDDVEKDKDDMPSHVHNEGIRSQATGP